MIRDHDKIVYLNKKTYLHKPKFAWKFLFNLIKKNKNKKITFWDVGCGNGYMLKYLEKQLPKWKFLGSDNFKELVKISKKNTNANIFLDDITKKPKFSTYKADIVHTTGVLCIYDNVENFLHQIINRCNKSGEIFLQGGINDKPVDVITRYRDCTKKNYWTNKINQPGWNKFSMKTISRILNKNEKTKEFKFIKIRFPKTLNVKKKSTDPMRSWTVVFNNEVYFTNSLNVLDNTYYLNIKLK
tara:strand:+ start:216 stop:941 length:726 start_codon:yes stop_codon:yes gene_type:complete